MIDSCTQSSHCRRACCYGCWLLEGVNSTPYCHPVEYFIGHQSEDIFMAEPERAMDLCPRVAINLQPEWEVLQLLIAFLKTLRCLPTSSLAHILSVQGQTQTNYLGSAEPDAIFIVPIVPFIPCGSMCKLILQAAHLNGANYISPLDNICLLPVVQ